MRDRIVIERGSNGYAVYTGDDETLDSVFNGVTGVMKFLKAKFPLAIQRKGRPAKIASIASKRKKAE